jgi:hypothetical protein
MAVLEIDRGYQQHGNVCKTECRGGKISGIPAHEVAQQLQASLGAFSG